MNQYSPEQIEEKFDYIIQEIESGRALRNVCKDEKAFNKDLFYKCIDSDPDKKERYARATDLRADAKFESIEEEYNKEPERDPMTGKIDMGWVALQRLKIDSKKFEVAKLAPKKYGDKLDITSDNKKIDVQPIFNINPLANKLEANTDDLQV